MPPALTLALAMFAVVSGAGAQTPDGARFFQRCFACHSLEPGDRNLSGPTLRGVFGRRAGTADGFEYSPAMREAGERGLVWGAETLDRFLEDPEDFLPGARMAGVWLRDPIERGTLIRWLKTVAR